MDLTKEDMDKRNSLPYPMEIGAPAFSPIPVDKEKDILLNIGKHHAKQEYDRIMEQVEVLKRQADALVNRLGVSEVMHKCVYGIKPYHGKTYYVYFDSYKGQNWLSMIHPRKWCAGPGKNNTFVMAVRMLGDSTWEEVLLED